MEVYYIPISGHYGNLSPKIKPIQLHHPWCALCFLVVQNIVCLSHFFFSPKGINQQHLTLDDVDNLTTILEPKSVLKLTFTI